MVIYLWRKDAISSVNYLVAVGMLLVVLTI